MEKLISDTLKLQIDRQAHSGGEKGGEGGSKPILFCELLLIVLAW